MKLVRNLMAPRGGIIGSCAPCRRLLAVLAGCSLVAGLVAAGQLPPSAPTNLRVVAGGASPLDVTVRPSHPRLHFNSDTLPRWRSWLAGPWKAQWQQMVGETGKLLSVKPNKPASNSDYFAMVWLGGTVPGIDYGPGRTPETFAQRGVEVLLEQVALGHPPQSANDPTKFDNQIYGRVNHPFHSNDELFGAMARAYDWLFDYPGFTDAHKRTVARYLGELAAQFFELQPGKKKVMVSPDGPFNVFDGSPGSEDHHPAYYGLAFYGDGYADAEAARMVAHFYQQWPEGYLDVFNFESRGDIGTRVLGNYGGWYPIRPLLMLHAWRSATGEDYITRDGYTWAVNYPSTYWALRKPHKPEALLPLGQTQVHLTPPTSTLQMLTGLPGPAGQLAAELGGPVRTGATPDYYLQVLTTANPETVPAPGPIKTWFSETYGLLVENRPDGTQLSMGAPPFRLRGHTWGTQGGGPISGVPLGVTLTVKGVPVLVKHRGAHRKAAARTYGQNIMRFYPDWSTVEEPSRSDALFGGFKGQPSRAKRSREMKPSDDLGGITTWEPGRAVADLTRWYRSDWVKHYERTYEWGSDFLRVVDETDLMPATDTYPEVQGWSRWYTGHRPVINGVPVADGFTDVSVVPGTIQLGPVTWTINAPAGTRLRIVGGEGHRWVHDQWELLDAKADNDAARDAGGWLEAGEWTITLIGPSGNWDHRFTWR